MHRLLVMLLMLASCAPMSTPVKLPPELAAVLPNECRQVLLVTAAGQHTSAAELKMLERAAGDEWHAVGHGIRTRIGRNGMAWGHGEFGLRAPKSWRIKKEGDGCSPAGVFRITQAFGDPPRTDWMKLPYLQCTAHHWGIDDVKSRYYNQIVDDRVVKCDWTRQETMVPGNGCYALGAEIAHNPRNVPGLGSCIFMHVWLGENKGTAGCTAMAKPDLKRVLAWLAPAAQPCLVQMVVKP